MPLPVLCLLTMRYLLGLQCLMDIEKELLDGDGRGAVRTHPACDSLPVSWLLQTQKLRAGVKGGEGLNPLPTYFLAAVLLPFRGRGAVSRWGVSPSAFICTVVSGNFFLILVSGYFSKQALLSVFSCVCLYRYYQWDVAGCPLKLDIVFCLILHFINLFKKVNSSYWHQRPLSG